jgi:hypothetical protein
MPCLSFYLFRRKNINFRGEKISTFLEKNSGNDFEKVKKHE